MKNILFAVVIIIQFTILTLSIWFLMFCINAVHEFNQNYGMRPQDTEESFCMRRVSLALETAPGYCLEYYH